MVPRQTAVLYHNTTTLIPENSTEVDFNTIHSGISELLSFMSVMSAEDETVVRYSKIKQILTSMKFDHYFMSNNGGER